MAPSLPLVAALFRVSNAQGDEKTSMLQMPAVEKVVQTDAADGECKCPGYYEEQCRENAFQGCIWSDRGDSNAPWCQCDPDFVPDPPLFIPPPAPPPPPVPPPPPACDETMSGNGADYRGCLTTTIHGHTCQNWMQQEPNAHTRTLSNYPNSGLGDHNMCRNPDGETNIWCYTIDGDRWEFCDEPPPPPPPVPAPEVCSEDTSDELQTDYRGCSATTVSGRTCQNWLNQEPHAHTRTPSNYPDTGLGNHNFCRNPDNEPNGIWCYTTDQSSRWEYCDPLPTQPTCPAGWVQVGQPGADIGGCGLESCGDRYNVGDSTEAACAAKCDTFEECDGFNFAPRYGDQNHEDQTVCTLYSSNDPTGTWSGSAGFVQVFCMRESAGSTSECADNVLEKCQGNTPCIDLREAAIHHHLMWLNDDGTAHVDGEANGINAGDSRTWTCTRDGDGVGLVGTWNCPGFYSTVIRITADFADDFTDARDNDFIHVCALPEAEHTGYGQPCTEGTATIDGVPVCTVESDDGNSNPWVLFGDIDHQITNFVGSQVSSSPTSSGQHNGDSVQVGTFSTGAIGSSGYSLDIGQFCTGGSCSANFDLMIQYGDADVFSHSENGYSTTSGGFINNGHTAQGVVIGEHGLWGSNTDRPNGYYATFCAYNGGCRGNGNDFWAFSTHGVYPNGANSVVCGMYYGGSGSPWKDCPGGDNGRRMRYYIRSPDLEVTFPSAD